MIFKKMIYKNTKYIQNITPESFKNAEKDLVFPITADFTNPSVTTPPNVRCLPQSSRSINGNPFQTPFLGPNGTNPQL